MQENKFENRVQTQMEGFRIHPSDAVWKKVEEELRKKKKRRIVFYIFLLAGLSLLGYSGYFLFNNSKPNLVHQNISLPDNNSSVKNNETATGTENSTVKIQQHKKEDQLHLEDEKIAAKEKTNSTGTNDIIFNEETINKEKSVIRKQERGVVKKISNKLSPVVTITRDNANNNNYSDNNDVTKNSVQTRENPLLHEERVIRRISRDSISRPMVAGKQFTEDRQLPVPGKNIQVKKDSIVEKIAANIQEASPSAKENKKTPKINWGIELSGGISSNRENAFSFDGGQKSLSAVYDSPPVNYTGSSARPAIVYMPSSIQSSPAFRAGVVAEMKISKKSSVSSGVRYAYFSNTIKVGTYKDTMVAFSNSYSQAVRVDAIYRGYHQEEYTNRFHFIQLPLQYQLQLNKGAKLPIMWNFGGSLGYLVSTNGLVYDTTASGIYYYDKAAFNKFHWNLNTGFSLRFGSRNKIQWSLGPELSLGMNKLTKDDYTRKQYLLYGGITGRIIFSKKK